MYWSNRFIYIYADAILANTPDQAETLLHSLERAAASIGLHVNAHKTEYMCYNQTGDISTLEGTPLKLVDKFTYLGSSVESTETDIETRLTKAWTAINRLSTIWKSDLTDKMKRSFFQAAVTSILLYGCTTWTLTKRLEKKLDGNYTRMLRAILNKSWQQHPTRHQLYGHLPPITKTIQVRRTRHIYIYIYIYIFVKVFVTGQRDLGSIAGQVLKKTQRMVHDTSLLNIQHNKVCIKGKCSNSGKGVVPTPIPQYNRYWNENLLCRPWLRSVN